MSLKTSLRPVNVCLVGLNTAVAVVVVAVVVGVIVLSPVQ